MVQNVCEVTGGRHSLNWKLAGAVYVCYSGAEVGSAGRNRSESGPVGGSEVSAERQSM